MKIVLVLEKDGEKLTGTIGNEEGSVPLDEVKVEKGEVTLKFQYQTSYTATLKLQGEALEGKYTSVRGDSGAVRFTR